MPVFCPIKKCRRPALVIFYIEGGIDTALRTSSVLLVERKYDSADKVEPIYRILVPALVLFIENIIELSPEVQVLRDLEFQPGIQIGRTGKSSRTTIAFHVFRAGPGK